MRFMKEREPKIEQALPANPSRKGVRAGVGKLGPEGKKSLGSRQSDTPCEALERPKSGCRECREVERPNVRKRIAESMRVAKQCADDEQKTEADPPREWEKEWETESDPLKHSATDAREINPKWRGGVDSTV